MEQIASGIYIEIGYLGVTLGALALPHGTILIDAPPCPEDARSWRAALRNLGSGVNRLLINLDSHYDRTLGVGALDCAVIAQEKASQRIIRRPAVFKGQLEGSGADWERCVGLSGIRWKIPDLTYTQHTLLHWADQPVILEHHPGPSPGTTWVIIPPAKVVFVADTVLLHQPPFLAKANLGDWVEGVDLLLSAKFRNFTIVSGRGGPLATEALRAQRRYLKYILRHLEKLASREAPPEETEAIIPKLLSDLDFSPDRQEQYTQRLRYGLSQYYLRHYQPAPVPPGS